MESLLLLFTDSLPCWDEETVKIAGENPDGLKALSESGDLLPVSGGYVLTEKGLITRENAAKDLYLPIIPAEIISDESKAHHLLEINRMTQLLDRAFVTDWGIKEVTTRETFPIMPCLKDDEYFAFSGERVIATWPEHETVKRFLSDFPNVGVAARKFPAPAQNGLDEWALRNNLAYGELTVDFVLRSRADFNHYKNYPQFESDKYKFLDSDQLFAHKVFCPSSPEELLPFIGKLHILLTLQRRIYLPGWFDIDHDENEDWHLLAFVTDSESELETLTRTLRSFGHELINPVNPLFIIGTSIERLRNQSQQKRTIYDWFDEDTVRILRPDYD
ncbi:MAG: hypothetical protein IJL18_09290 [Synergistaceae bacterium]|nr:hypothetical protein [Synergistaceae bacterium]